MIQKRGIVQLSTPIKKGIYSRYSMGIKNEDGIAAVGLKQKIILKQRKPKFNLPIYLFSRFYILHKGCLFETEKTWKHEL